MIIVEAVYAACMVGPYAFAFCLYIVFSLSEHVLDENERKEFISQKLLELGTRNFTIIFSIYRAIC